MVHAMGKAAAARSVEELEALAESVPPMAYDIDNYATLGLLWETLSVDSIEQPSADDLASVRDCLNKAVAHIGGNSDLRGRLGAPNREASSRVRELLRAQCAAANGGRAQPVNPAMNNKSRETAMYQPEDLLPRPALGHARRAVAGRCPGLGGRRARGWTAGGGATCARGLWPGRGRLAWCDA